MIKEARGARRVSGRLASEWRQDQEIRVIAEQLQFFARSEKEQGITDLKTLVGQIGANGFSFAPDAGELNVVALTKVSAPPTVLPASRLRGSRVASISVSPFGFEGAEIRRTCRVDFQFLQAAQYIEVLGLTFDQQQVAAGKQLVAARHHLQRAVTENRNHPEVKNIRKAGSSSE